MHTTESAEPTNRLPLNTFDRSDSSYRIQRSEARFQHKSRYRSWGDADLCFSNEQGANALTEESDGGMV